MRGIFRLFVVVAIIALLFLIFQWLYKQIPASNPPTVTPGQATATPRRATSTPRPPSTPQQFPVTPDHQPQTQSQASPTADQPFPATPENQPPTGTQLPTAAPDSAPGNVPEMATKPKAKESTFKGCPPKGDGGITALNLKKNRIDEGNYVPVNFDAVVRLPGPKAAQVSALALLSPNEKAGVARYEGIPIAVEGYLVGVKEEGPESTNCHGADHEFRDYHVWLVKSASQDRSKSIVIEVTPRLRAKHPSWDKTYLQQLVEAKTQVRISGWLMFDPEHPDQVGKTRATLWEIHPIMRIEVQHQGKWALLDDVVGK